MEMACYLNMFSFSLGVFKTLNTFIKLVICNKCDISPTIFKHYPTTRVTPPWLDIEKKPNTIHQN